MLKESDVLELCERPERMVSLFRMALSLSHCDTSLTKSILNLIPMDGTTSFEQVDLMRMYMSESSPPSDVIHLFRQCIFKLENSLVEAEDGRKKPGVSPGGQDLVEGISSVSEQDRYSEFSSDDERSSDEIENRFITDLARVLRRGMKLYQESDKQHSQLSTIVPAEVNGEERNYLNPTVLWYQDDERVIMTLDRIGKCSLITTTDSLQFRLLDSNTEQQYGFDLQLFGQMTSATYSQKGQQTRIQIYKATSGTWCRLQKATKRPWFLHYDTSQLDVPMSDASNEPKLPFDYESDSSDLSSDCLEPSHYDEKQAHYEE